MKSHRFNKVNTGRRRGQAIIYLALALPVILGVAAYVVDLGFLYKERAEAQKAADAAALAGAYHLSTTRNPTASGVQLFAKDYATLNGFPTSGNSGQNHRKGITFTDSGTAGWPPGPDNHNNWYHVVITAREPTFFAGIFGSHNRQIAASATALYEIRTEIPISPQYYGINSGPVNFTMFGPYGLRSNGDYISPKYLDNGQPNPDYNGKGYNFTLRVPTNYESRNGTNQVQVELFDPDCYNSGTNNVDEIRTGHPGRSSDYTTTVYTLIYDKSGNPFTSDPNDHVTIATATYGNNPETNGQWVTPPNFTFNLTGLYDSRTFRINVTTIDGSSENGFNLRAGPPHPTTALPNGLGGSANMTEAEWHEQLSGAPGTTGAAKNGTSIAAQGDLPMNFNFNGTADITLGFVPETAAGGQFTIKKFDLDVGSTNLYYTCDSLPGQTFPGTLANSRGQKNDVFTTDTITLPENYTGGTWHAHYTAGGEDTSVWSLSYDRGNGVPGRIRLVE